MDTIASLYERFGVPSSCSDSELSKAYRELLFVTHPDRNPDDPDATLKTQRLTQAYAELKNYRSRAASGEQPDFTEWFAFSVQASFAVDVGRVAGIKTRFTASWEALQDQPTDPLRALRFIHAAFEAERGDSDFVVRLLVDPILIDLAATLLWDTTGADQYARCATLSRWAGYLKSVGHVGAALQILEDAVESSLALPNLKDELRSHHYAAAQYPHPTTGVKPAPEPRIRHLRRIVELGYDLGYVHKMLAEAYHELGDDERARASLEYAYRIDPDLSGAVRITRALGLAAKARGHQTGLVATTPRWTRPEQIPEPRQIRLWAEQRDWNRVLDFSKPDDYSPRILPAARGTLRTVAVSLGNGGVAGIESALLGLLRFDYYWDVAQAAATALSKVGGANSLAALDQFRAKATGTGESYLRNCLSYLRARLDKSNALVGGDQSGLLAQARQEARLGNYGIVRFLLENLIIHMLREHPQFDEMTALWARSCAEMNDFETAVEIVRPVYAALRDGGHLETLDEIGQWLWNATLPFEKYHDGLDDHYQWALELNLSLVMSAATPDGVLGPLRSSTRWLERLNRGASANVIRDLIRTEAPGTLYVDGHNRENYLRPAVLTERMKSYLQTFDDRIKKEAVPKLKAVMGSQRWIQHG